jgi:hypothetical protein
MNKIKTTLYATLAAMVVGLGSGATAQAAPYHEWHGATADPKGVVIAVHGGGWRSRTASVWWRQALPWSR